MNEVSCRFTLQELAALRQLLNLALMAKGMDVAQAALALDQKIAEALNAFAAARQAEASTRASAERAAT